MDPDPIFCLAPILLLVSLSAVWEMKMRVLFPLQDHLSNSSSLAQELASKAIFDFEKAINSCDIPQHMGLLRVQEHRNQLDLLHASLVTCLKA